MASFRSTQAILMLAALALAVAPTLAAAEAVGTAGAANTRSAGTAPGGAQKVIQIGEQVVRDEKVETSASGSVQVVFIDKTTLNIGPNSSLTIDKFVFNPASSTGQIALTLGRGVLRVVGGQATHSGGATITTPVATIGIRGGIVTVSHFADGTVVPLAGSAHGHHHKKGHGPGSSSQMPSQFASLWSPPGTHAVLHFGKMEVTANGVTETILRPGFGCFVTTDIAATPTHPAKFSQVEIDTANSLLTSKGKQTGGTTNVPTDTTAADGGLGAHNEYTSTTTQPRQQQTTAKNDLPTVGGTYTDTSVQQGVGQGAASDTTTSPPPTGAAPTGYFLTSAPPSSSHAMPIAGAIHAEGGAVVSTGGQPIYGYSGGGLDAHGKPSQLSTNFQASVSIHGHGRHQSSSLTVMTSAIDGTTVAGGFDTVSRRGHHRASHASGTVGSVPATIATNGAGVPTAPFDLVQTSGPETHGFPAQTLTPGTPPPGTDIGKNHPALTLQGYAGGLVTISNGKFGQAFIVTNRDGVPGNVSISLFDSSRMSAQFNVAASESNSPIGSATLNFGAAPDTATAHYDPSRAAYVDLTHFAARAQTVSTGGAFGGTSQFFDSDHNALPFVADEGSLNKDPVSLTLVNSGALDLGSFFTSQHVTPCACDYTQWGLWSASTNQPIGVGERTLNVDTGIAFWVAGTPVGASDLPQMGTATYSGHVIASIEKGSSQYIAAGGFSSLVDFGQHSQMFNVTNLDHTNYSGQLKGALSPQFSAELLSSGSRVMSLNGSFFKGGEMGGNVSITGYNYLGSGIFAAKAPAH